ncbi:MAG: tetratricopeptide repeat protein, partial [Deltaproteobacteria bacterium]|nr:tetratricopeptide repeat protein [Deltaproteobacteria bacterium]
SFEQKGQFAEALKVRQKLVDLAPLEGTHRIRLAESYQREEKKEEAIEQYEALAKQYKKEGKDPKHLIDLYEKILPSRPDNRSMLNELVRLYASRKEFQKGVKWLEQRQTLVNTDPELLSLQARLYKALNQVDSARGKYQQLAHLYAEQDEPEKALAAYEDILVLLPEEAKTIQEEVEELEEGAFAAMTERAEDRRAKEKRDELEAEAAVEAEKDRMEEERREAKEGKKSQRGGKKPAAKIATPEKKPVKVSAAPIPPASALSIKTIDVEKELQTVRSLLSLVNTYRLGGLTDEAEHESSLAKEKLEKILEKNPDHTEAKKLLGALKKK